MNNNVTDKQEVQNEIKIDLGIVPDSSTLDVYRPKSNTTKIKPSPGLAIVKKVIYDYPASAIIANKEADVEVRYAYFIQAIEYPKSESQSMVNVNNSLAEYKIGDKILLTGTTTNANNKIYTIKDSNSYNGIQKIYKDMEKSELAKITMDRVTITEYFIISIYEIKGIIED